MQRQRHPQRVSAVGAVAVQAAAVAAASAAAWQGNHWLSRRGSASCAFDHVHGTHSKDMISVVGVHQVEHACP